MSLFSWIENLIEDVGTTLKRAQDGLDNNSLQKLRDSQQRLKSGEVWTEDGAPPAKPMEQLNAIVDDMEKLVQIIDRLQSSMNVASDIVRDGDRNIKNQVDGLDQTFKNI